MSPWRRRSAEPSIAPFVAAAPQIDLTEPAPRSAPMEWGFTDADRGVYSRQPDGSVRLIGRYEDPAAAYEFFSSEYRRLIRQADGIEALLARGGVDVSAVINGTQHLLDRLAGQDLIGDLEALAQRYEAILKQAEQLSLSC